MTRVPVSKNIGKKIPLDGRRRFRRDRRVPAQCQAPGRRPLREPGRQAPQSGRRAAGLLCPASRSRSARLPRPSFASPGGMHIEKCPVKFWYHHPAVAAEPAVEFLATSDGKLYCRVGNGKYESRGEVHAGDTLDAWADTSVSIVNFVPHARRELIFTPVKVARGDRETFEAAAEVELTAGDTTRTPLAATRRRRRNADPGQDLRRHAGDFLRLRKPAAGLFLAVEEVHAGHEPRRDGRRLASPAPCTCTTKPRISTRTSEISMNEPLVHGKYTFYQSGILPSGTGTVLTVASRPGPVLEVSRQHHDLCGHADHVRHAFPARQGPAIPFFPDNDQDQGANYATCHRGQPGICLPRRFGLWGIRPRDRADSIGMPGDRCPSRTAAGRSRWTASPGKPGACWAIASASPTRRRTNRSTRRPSTWPRCWILPPGTRMPALVRLSRSPRKAGLDGRDAG